MVDYSKFDGIDIPSDDEEDTTIFNIKKASNYIIPNENLEIDDKMIANNNVKKVEESSKGRTRKNEDGRFIFEYNGETIYEKMHCWALCIRTADVPVITLCVDCRESAPTLPGQDAGLT